MPKLIIQDQLKIKKPIVIPIDTNTVAIDALVKNFKTLDPLKTTIYINDVLTLPSDPSLLQELNEHDTITVINEVKGVIGDVVGGVFDVVGDILGELINVDVPEIDTETSGSPNNTFSGQTNVIKPYVMIPVVCGSPRVYPYLAAPALEYYVDNNKVVEQSFIVSYGTFSGGTVLAGESLALNSGASVERFIPNTNSTTTIPSYRVSQEVDEVSGQTIRGTNEGTVGNTYNLTQATTPTTFFGSTFTAYVDQDTVSDQLKSDIDDGLTTLRINYTITTQDAEGEPDVRNVVGSGEISEMTLIGAEYKIVLTNFTGQFSLDDYIVISANSIISGGIGPFKNPIDCVKMFFNIEFVKGLKNTVNLEVKVYRTDGKNGDRIAGTEETFNVSYTEDSPNDPIRRTFEVQPTGLGTGEDWYEFECYRTNTESQDATLPDVATLESVHCVKELGDFDFYNLTMMRVIIRASNNDRKTSASNKINIINGTQEMPSYVNGVITENAASRNFADAVLFVWRDFYKQDVDLIDLDELYTIADSLPVDLKEFDYTFDDLDMGVGAVLDTILDVARVSRYWDGTKIRFWRDESTLSSGLISRSDIASEGDRNYQLTRSCYIAGEYDSIQIEYVDREINKKAYIYRSFDSSGNIVNVAGANPKNKYIVGCQSVTNATNRAELEIRKLKYNRWTLSDTFIDSQRIRQKGDVIKYNELYEGGDSFGGDIISLTVNTAKTSGILSLDESKSYELYYTNDIGGLIGPQSVLSSTSNSFTVNDLSQAYSRGFDGAQLGSRYFITEVNDSMIRQWRVVGKSSSGYDTQLDFIGYDERVYEYDTI